MRPSIPVLAAAASALVLTTTAHAQPYNLVAASEQPSVVRDMTRVGPDGPANQSPFSTYIVRLENAPVATYTGGLPGLAATANSVTGADRLDTNSRASRAYVDFLVSRHAEFQALTSDILRRSVEPSYEYGYAFNGMALSLTEGEAETLRGLPGVAAIEKDKSYALNTDIGPRHIGAETIWNGIGTTGSKGEGTVIAILDSGINSSHPSFAAVGSDGYSHTNPLGAGNYVPGSYCDVVDPSFCNNKLIGAWNMVQSAADPGSPEDSDGHGSHTAATAGGNFVTGAAIIAPTTSFVRDVSGVAPHANIIAYDVCIDSCPGAAILGALDQVVIDASALPDGIHALNYSISGDPDPWSSATELGFLNATAAGIYVSASAGNSGPGASTVAHESPWVATVAALTHPRRIDNSLTGLSSAGSTIPDILGAGLTTGYGPAPIVYAGDYPTANGSPNDTQPEQCLAPFPAGTFNGEIVVCDRGSIARVAKGANVLAGGAGGYVLANDAGSGESIVADPHFLPGVHIGFTDGVALKAWIAAETDTMASISGYGANLIPSAGDNLAGFSSRGPSNNAVDILKPDIGAPGVSIMAAVRNDPSTAAAEYDFLSGTSMSSPHNAGAGALVAATTNWTPYEIRSALMMTAVPPSDLVKEDGSTVADPFDSGAGRIDLSRVLDVGIVLDETPANFLAADPAAGGDPKTLNLASMQDSQCVGECGWTRTIRNVSSLPIAMNLSVTSPSGLDMTVDEPFIWMSPGAEKVIRVRVNSTLANDGEWAFGQLNLIPAGWGGYANQPDLHMPIAVRPAFTSAPGVLSTGASASSASAGDTVTMTIDITNNTMTGGIRMWDFVPRNMRVDRNSLQATVTNGTTTQPFGLGSFAGSDWLKWEGELQPGGLTVGAAPAPFGYFSLPAFGIAPFGCPANCDDGAVTLNVPPFIYNGQTYTSVIWSVNGTLEPGAESGLATSFANQNLPSTTAPNNLIAPFWTDLNMGSDGDGAEWYVAVLNAGPRQFTIYEWNNIPLFGDTTNRYTFQVWVETGTSNIFFTYALLGDTSGATVGVENADGTIGQSYWFEGTGTSPVVGTDLGIAATPGGSVQLSFDVRTTRCGRRNPTMVNEVQMTNGGTTERAIAVVTCTP